MSSVRDVCEAHLKLKIKQIFICRNTYRLVSLGAVRDVSEAHLKLKIKQIFICSNTYRLVSLGAVRDVSEAHLELKIKQIFICNNTYRLVSHQTKIKFFYVATSDNINLRDEDVSKNERLKRKSFLVVMLSEVEADRQKNCSVNPCSHSKKVDSLSDSVSPNE